MDKDVYFNDFIEWKLYQLHKPAHARLMKRQTSSGMCSRSIDDVKANLYLVAAEPAAHASQPSTSIPKPESSIMFDPVKAAAQDAARGA